MSRLIGVFAMRTCHIVSFVTRRLISYSKHSVIREHSNVVNRSLGRTDKMSSQDYDELEKLFNGIWHTVRDENMEAFNDAAGFPEEMKKFVAQEKSYAFTRDGDSFRETTTFGPGVELKSCLKLNQLNDWKDSEENPKMHIQTTPTFKDGVLTQDINPMMANAGKKHTIKIFRQGDELVAECSVPGGPTGKRFYKKQ